MVNILVCGIDYEEGRNYSNDPTSNDGMTDMILYCQFDIKGGALRMLQIPRNSLVCTKSRKVALSNGKTYAATNYQINSVALSNGGSIAALAEVIYDQYKLPVDYYVTVDMQALVEMVDNFGGIEVYIPTICPLRAAPSSRATAIWTAHRRSSSSAAATVRATPTPTSTA